MRWTDLPTPAALVDLDVLERNCAAMARKAMALGVRLRPHVKTHKTLEAARLQVAGHFGGITVSTLAEARFFGAGGFRDITFAVPLAPGRAAEVVALAASLDQFQVLVDDEFAVTALERAALRVGRQASVFLKVDCGYHRAGVDPGSASAVRLAARIAASRSLDLVGVLAHGGHAYGARDRAGVLAAARDEHGATVAFAERLRAAGIAVREVSIGSTPTMAVATDLAGVTEIRPGNYAYHDASQVALGSCAAADCAFSVSATVIGVHPARGQAVVDAGALALSKDTGAPQTSGWPGGYGKLLRATSDEPLGDLALVALSQEHGVVRGRAEDLARLRVGDVVRIVPNHSCLAAACFSEVHAVRGDEVAATWRACRGR